MPRIVETTVYELHELSERARENARAWFREELGDWDWHDAIFDDFAQACELLGVTLQTRDARLMGGGTRQEPCIYFSGFYSQGDGACFEGTYAHRKDAIRCIRQFAPEDAELHRITDMLEEAQRANGFSLCAVTRHRGRACHACSMEISVEHADADTGEIAADATETVAERLRDLARWLYRQLEREWDYMMSDEYADEGVAVNQYTFTEDGRRFG